MSPTVQRIADFLKERYAVEVVVDDFADGEDIEIGALSDKKILVNKKSRGETEIYFVIAHLFGHMVQFTNYTKYKELVEEVEKPKPLVLSENFKKSFYSYEVEGYKIGKRLLETVLGGEVVDALDEKFQVYLDTDFTSFWDYLTTGEQVSIDEFNALLERRYVEWEGNYPNKLETIELPLEVNPQKDVVVY